MHRPIKKTLKAKHSKRDFARNACVRYLVNKDKIEINYRFENHILYFNNKFFFN